MNMTINAIDAFIDVRKLTSNNNEAIKELGETSCLSSNFNKAIDVGELLKGGFEGYLIFWEGLIGQGLKKKRGRPTLDRPLDK